MSKDGSHGSTDARPGRSGTPATCVLVLGCVALWAGTAPAEDVPAEMLVVQPGEAQVKLGENLLRNGTFDELEPSQPPRWVLRGPTFGDADRVPDVARYWDFWDPKHTWVIRKFDPEHGPVACVEMDEYMAAFDGVQVYSQYIPIKEGIVYRFSADLMTEAPSIIIWVKGYGPADYGGRLLPMDELYRSQRQIHGLTKKTWKRYDVHYLVKPATELTNIPYKKITHVRCMLYCYWPKGRVYYDNCRFEAVKRWRPPPKPKRQGQTAGQKQGQSDEDAIAQMTDQQLFWTAAKPYQAKRWAAALPLANELAKRQPNNCEFRLLRAEVLHGLGKHKQAQADLSVVDKTLPALLRKEPQHRWRWMPSKLWVVHGWVASAQGDKARARTCYQKAIKLNTSPHAVKAAREALSAP